MRIECTFTSRVVALRQMLHRQIESRQMKYTAFAEILDCICLRDRSIEWRQYRIRVLPQAMTS